DLGYQVVAVEQVIVGKVPANNPCKMSDQRLEQLQKARSILRRLTIVASDPNANIGISGSNSALAPFDIIAVQPTNERMFLLACQSMEVDIISIDLTERLSFQLKHNAIGLAISRGIMFEIKYSPAIVNPTSVRPLLINNALNLVRVTRGKHLILSSGYAAKNGFGGMRPPHDVMNMAALFSLNQTMARPCILDNCRATIFHADTRKSIHKSVV
ncbi:PHP domain-like protein, partial [Ramicandelaber brevisporus]